MKKATSAVHTIFFSSSRLLLFSMVKSMIIPLHTLPPIFENIFDFLYPVPHCTSVPLLCMQKTMTFERTGQKNRPNNY